MSTIIRQDLNVDLSPMEIEHRIIKYGEFSRLDQRINSENSETTHQRLIKNPEEWMEYHRQYRDARKNWTIIPYEQIIKRIEELSSQASDRRFRLRRSKNNGTFWKSESL